MTRTLALALCLAGIAAGPLAAEPLVVAIDHSTRLNVSGSAASVVVGNPQVADVTVVDSHTVFVSGRGYGETDVVVLDGAGRTLFSGEITVGARGGGRVSVYRGAARTDMACAPGCEVSFRSPTKGTSSGSEGGAAAAPTSAQPAGGGLGQMLGGAMSQAASGVGHALGSVMPAQQQ